MRTLLFLLALSLASATQAQTIYTIDVANGRWAPVGGYYYASPAYYAPVYRHYGYYGGGGRYDSETAYELRRLRWQLEDDAFDRRWSRFNRRWER